MNRMFFTITLALATSACGGNFDPQLGDLNSGTEGFGGYTGTDPSESPDGSDSGDETGTGTDEGPSTEEPDEGDTGSETETGIPDGCGDGVAQGFEECDGLDLRGKECGGLVSPGNGNYNGGQLACNDDCTFDMDVCTYCGDQIKNSPEEVCDGPDMGTDSCEGAGFDGGELSCNAQCGLVETACANCEGNPEGMYSNSWENCSAGGVQGTTVKGDFFMCLPTCQQDADCADPDLAFCTVEPACRNSRCELPCETDADCPSGDLYCYPAPDAYCVWNT